MSVAKTTVVIVVVCLAMLFIIKTITKTKTVFKKPSPSFIYPLNYTINCTGKIYFLKKNNGIDSTYLIHFVYKNNDIKMNVSYYGIFLHKEVESRAPYFLINVLLNNIRYDENLSYILSGSEDWYSMRFYYKNNKELFQSLFFGLEFLYPKKFRFLMKHYEILNNSYVFMNVKNYYPRYIELYMAFKNNTSLFYVDAKCFFKQNPFLYEDF